MSDATFIDLPAYYASHFRPGGIDLSASSPPAGRLPSLPRDLAGIDLAHSTPGGSLALRTAIAARYETLSAGDILVCAGASEALSALAFANLDRESTLWTERGSYSSLISAARHCGARIEDFGGSNRSALAVTNNPGVPFGDLRDLPRFIDASLAAGAIPAVDEVYRDLALDGRRIPAAADLHPEAVSIGDLSKPLGLGGLRIGWVASRNQALLRRIDRELQLLSGGPSTLSVAIAEAVMGSFDTTVAKTLEFARKNRERVFEVLAARGWRVCSPEAGLTAFAGAPTLVTSEALERLAAEGYFLLPSSVFGVRGGFRISLLADPATLDRALTILAARTDSVAPANHLVVLTKSPGSGRSKTRIASTLGSAATARLAHAFVADTLALATNRRWQTTVALEPIADAPRFASLVPGAAFVAQPDGDLGARILGALESANPGGPAVLIGSDTPDLPTAILDDAFRLLETHDAVIGPAADGGFYLLGLRAPIPGVFDGLEWSTATVFERTVANIKAAGHTCAVLREWQDIDDSRSLADLSERLRGGDSAPATRAVLATLAAEVPVVR